MFWLDPNVGVVVVETWKDPEELASLLAEYLFEDKLPTFEIYYHLHDDTFVNLSGVRCWRGNYGVKRSPFLQGHGLISNELCMRLPDVAIWSGGFQPKTKLLSVHANSCQAKVFFLLSDASARHFPIGMGVTWNINVIWEFIRSIPYIEVYTLDLLSSVSVEC